MSLFYADTSFIGAEHAEGRESMKSEYQKQEDYRAGYPTQKPAWFSARF